MYVYVYAYMYAHKPACMHICMYNYVQVIVLYGHMHRNIAQQLSVMFQEPLMFIIGTKTDHFRQATIKGATQMSRYICPHM